MKKTKQKGFLGQSRKFVRTSIFVTIFALIGVYGLVMSHAAATPSVRFVLFCAQDKCSGNVSTVRFRGHQVQNWYKSQLGAGHTFHMMNTIKVTGSHNAAWYSGGNSSVDGSTTNTIARIYKNEASKLHETNVKTVVVLGFPSMGHCGVTYSGEWLSVIDPQSYVLAGHDCRTYQNSVYAHELGHTFNLARIGGNERADGTVMDGNACSGKTLGHCSMNSTDRSYLLNSQSSWFPNVTSSSIEPDAEASDATSFQDVVPLYEYQSDGCTDHIYSTTYATGTWAPEGNGCWYNYKGIAAYALQASDSATLPLKVYYNAGNHKHFYTTHPETACYGYPIEYCSYNLEANLAYIYTSQPYLAVKIADYKNSGNNHVLSTHPGDSCPNGAGGGGSDLVTVCLFPWFQDVGFVYNADPSN
jgi:hypothetical protein